MNQKTTLRFADHVLTFVVPEAEVVEIRLAFRRKWPYKFVRANGDFHVSFDQVLWMKISPVDDAEQETVEEKIYSLFEPLRASLASSAGGTP